MWTYRADEYYLRNRRGRFSYRRGSDPRTRRIVGSVNRKQICKEISVKWQSSAKVERVKGLTAKAIRAKNSTDLRENWCPLRDSNPRPQD